MGIQRNESAGSFYSNESGNNNSGFGGSMELLHGYDQTQLLKPQQKNYSSDPGLKGVTLSWHGVSAYVPIPRPGFGIFQRSDRHHPFKRVLSSVTGILHPGTLMAVMGASGAGKTTLMNVLSKRAQRNVVIDGDVRVNGHSIGKSMGKISGYVYQDDLFFSTLTVLEHLTFMARMKLDRRLTKWERQRKVEELLVELGLKKCLNTRIERLSGGERKRLAFATEVIVGCPLLFADECTTGLDSFSAQRIVRVMRNLAANGTTIMCTIHQPSSQIFDMFDQVCLLSEGRTAYLGSSLGAMTFFAERQYVCPEHFNPADFYIRILAPGKEKGGRDNSKAICDAFMSSTEYIQMEQEISEEIIRYDSMSTSLSSKSSDSFSDQTLLGHHIRKPFWLTQFGWLAWRSLIDSWRNPQMHIVRTVQKIVLALLIGFCFFGVTLDQKGIQNIQGAIFIFITENTFPSMYGMLHVFPQELPIFLRENKNGIYGVGAYYLAKVLSLIPGFIFEPLIFVSIAYWLVGLRATVTAFGLTCVVILLTANTAAACGCFFSAAFDSVNVAITCLIPFDYILMITGGLFINLESLPDYLSWTKFLSWFMYANEAMSVAQFTDIKNITCSADPTVPCITTGTGVLDARSFNESHFPMDCVALISLYSAFHMGAFLSLLLKSYRR